MKNIIKKINQEFVYKNILSDQTVLKCCLKAIRYSFLTSLLYGVSHFFLTLSNPVYIYGEDVIDVVRDSTYVILYLAAFRILYLNKQNKIYSWSVYFLLVLVLLYNYNYFLLYVIYALIGGQAEWLTVIRNSLFFYFFFLPFFVSMYLKKNQLLAWAFFGILPLLWSLCNSRYFVLFIVLNALGVLIGWGLRKIISIKSVNKKT